MIGKIRAQGGVLIGKTNCDAFGHGASNENSMYGPVKNPHDLKKVSGGSSGGAAASVAAHKVLRQDFRFLAPKLYGEEIPLGMPKREGRTSSMYSLTIQYSEEVDCFEAFIHELPECRAVGKTRETAFYALRDRYIIFHSIRKLKLLPPKHLLQAA